MGTKSVFAKNAKVNYTKKDIANNHGTDDLGQKLLKCLVHLKKLNIQGVVQGDLLFTDEDITRKNVDGKPNLTFTPNTITYAVPEASDLGKQIDRAKVGIIFHTTYVGDSLADDLGWERSFVGTQFLAFSTSLPELAASFAALRINAPQLAISNVLGSNLFNMRFILFMDDLIYTDGSIWAVVESIHILTAVFAIIMTCVVLVGLTSRGRSRPTKLLTFESVLLIFMYIVTSVAIFSFA